MRFRLTRALVVALALAAGPLVVAAPQSTLPARISDADFWKLTQDLSEPNGSFRSDNLLSNEMVFSRVLPELLSKARPEGVYMGVGPEQNFTYMAAIRPKIAFITDIRRGNLHLHLMYKALFELSADRAEFVSRLFTKPRPAGLSAPSSAVDLMNAYWNVPTSDEAIYNTNLKAILDVLRVKHRLPLDEADVAGITYVYHSFYWFGPSITYSSSTAPVAVQIRGTTYADLMMQIDQDGAGLSYLASEEKFAFLKDLESRNLVVPVVGNFGGPKAIRAVGSYLREHGAVVTAFYLSNVEQYLTQDGIWNTFCQNVATLPLDEASVFIRPSGLGGAFFFNAPATGGVYNLQLVVPSGTNQLDAAARQRLTEQLRQAQVQLQAQLNAQPPQPVSPPMGVGAGNVTARTATPSIQTEIKACTGSAPER